LIDDPIRNIPSTFFILIQDFFLIQRTHDMLKLNFCFPNWPPVVQLLIVGEVSGLYAFLYLKSSQLLMIMVALLRPVKTFQFDI